MAIPKIIHYCWFGRGEISEADKKCIESWHMYCPDYEFILWNEDNFDISCLPYVREAYEAKKYAFVSDYARLWALYEYGGFYMDTDTELYKPLDDLCSYPAVICMEDDDYISCGLIGAEKGNSWIRSIIDTYKDTHFLMPDGTLDTTSIPYRVTKLTADVYGYKARVTGGSIDGVVEIFPFDYFCTMDYKTGNILKSRKSYAVHHYNASWLEKGIVRSGGIKRRISTFIERVFGYRVYYNLLRFRKRIKSGDNGR